jgi:ABC-type multidrug transport system ATPase subunit
MFVEEVMTLVELDVLRNAMVGLPGVDGLSTEQRKRLTIAVELVSNPSIIFMDEPTSGLDARAAAIVMRAVRNTVNTGRTVVCTIHQPSIDIFESFDDVLSLYMHIFLFCFLSIYSCVSLYFYVVLPLSNSQLVPFVASTFEKRRAGYLCW